MNSGASVPLSFEKSEDGGTILLSAYSTVRQVVRGLQRMKLIREYSAAEHFPEEEGCSCFLFIQDQCWGLDGSRKCLAGFCDGKLQTRLLRRSYQKIVKCPSADGYLAYEKNWKREVVLHILDGEFRELDAVSIGLEPSCNVEDIWWEEQEGLVYLVCSGIILKYNLNGDCLGMCMRASCDTGYRAMCRGEGVFFLAYERGGCLYIGEYGLNGAYLGRFCVGHGYQAGNMDLIWEDCGCVLRLYIKRRGEIPLFQDFLIMENDVEKPMEIQLSKGDGIGEVTCFWQEERACHNLDE